jgi:hypothetical protein
MRKPEVDHILMKMLESNVNISAIILTMDRQLKLALYLVIA